MCFQFGLSVRCLSNFACYCNFRVRVFTSVYILFKACGYVSLYQYLRMFCFLMCFLYVFAKLCPGISWFKRCFSWVISSSWTIQMPIAQDERAPSKEAHVSFMWMVECNNHITKSDTKIPDSRLWILLPVPLWVSTFHFSLFTFSFSGTLTLFLNKDGN